MTRGSNCFGLRWFLPLMLVVEGCSVLTPQADPSRFFMLTPSAEALADEPTGMKASEVSLGIGPVTLPEYLKRPEMVIRTSADEVKLSDTDRWAEPLESNFQSVLGQNLANLLGTQKIVFFPWYGLPQIDYQVQVQVYRFDISPVGQACLRARWIVKDPKDGAILAAKEDSMTSQAVAADRSGSAALSQTLAMLDREIAESIVQLNRSGPSALTYPRE